MAPDSWHRELTWDITDNCEEHPGTVLASDVGLTPTST
jgi:hypothetical protein